MKRAMRDNLSNSVMIINGEFHPDKSGQVAATEIKL